jgi:hypothetical protein
MQREPATFWRRGCRFYLGNIFSITRKPCQEFFCLRLRDPGSDQANCLVLFMKGEKRGLFFILEEYFQRQNRPSTEDAKDGRVR